MTRDGHDITIENTKGRVTIVPWAKVMPGGVCEYHITSEGDFIEDTSYRKSFMAILGLDKSSLHAMMQSCTIAWFAL